MNNKIMKLQIFQDEASDIITKDKEKFEKELKMKMFEKEEEIKKLKEQR